MKKWAVSRVINTDKAGCYTKAIRVLKEQGKLCEDTIYWQVKS